jgi:hypothetical protein
MTDSHVDNADSLVSQVPSDEDILIQEYEDEDESLEVNADPQGSEERLNLPISDKNDSQDQDDDEDEDETGAFVSDDSEADLLTILQSKVHAESIEEDNGECVLEEDEFADQIVLIPRQIGEQHCQRCWLLVRTNAPKCPTHDDDCPIFAVR